MTLLHLLTRTRNVIVRNEVRRGSGCIRVREIRVSIISRALECVTNFGDLRSYFCNRKPVLFFVVRVITLGAYTSVVGTRLLQSF